MIYLSQISSTYSPFFLIQWKILGKIPKKNLTEVDGIRIVPFPSQIMDIFLVMGKAGKGKIKFNFQYDEVQTNPGSQQIIDFQSTIFDTNIKISSKMGSEMGFYQSLPPLVSLFAANTLFRLDFKNSRKNAEDFVFSIVLKKQ